MPLTTCWKDIPEGADIGQPWLGLTGCTCCVHYGPCPQDDCDEFRCVTCGEGDDEEEEDPCP